MKVKPNNYIAIEFSSRSVNEGLARAAVAAFAAQLDPTLDELGDIKTAVSEADERHRPCLSAGDRQDRAARMHFRRKSP